MKNHTLSGCIGCVCLSCHRTVGHAPSPIKGRSDSVDSVKLSVSETSHLIRAISLNQIKRKTQKITNEILSLVYLIIGVSRNEYREACKNRQVNARENQRGNHEWTIQRHWQHQAHKTKGEDKQNTTQQRKQKIGATQTPPKIGDEPMCSRRVSSSCLLLDKHHVTHIVKTFGRHYAQANTINNRYKHKVFFIKQTD